MVADYSQPPVVEKRVRFFDGQFLQDQDFIDEQRYQLDRRRRHNRLLHVSGIADGLSVTAAPNAVTITAGTAIDADGRELVLAAASTVDLPAGTYNGVSGIRICLCYQETPTDQQAREGSSDDTRWLERPELLRLLQGEAHAGPYPLVPLATVAVSTGGVVTVDGSARAYSGVRLNGAGAALTLSASGTGYARLDGPLTVAGHLGVGTPAPENAESWTRVLDVLGTVSTKVSVRTDTVDARVFAHETGWWKAPAGMVVGTRGNHPVSIATNAAGRLTVTGDGRVGIGTDKPVGPLDVAQRPRTGTHPGNVRGVYATGDIGSRDSGHEFRHTNGTAGIGLGFNTIYATGSNADQHLNLLSRGKGNVGVNTPEPRQTLHVGGGLAVDGGVIQRGGPALTATSDLGLYSMDNGYWMRFVTAQGPIKFFTDGGAGTDPAMTIRMDGPGTYSVGVNGDPPSPAEARMTISGAQWHQQLRRVGADATGGNVVFLELYQPDGVPPKVPEVRPSIRFHHGNRFWKRIEGQPSGFHLKEGNPTDDTYCDLTARNVWATGQLYFQPWTNWGYDGRFGGPANRYWQISRPNWNQNDFSDGTASLKATTTPFPSDARFKTDVTPIADALSKVAVLRGVTFDWNEAGRRYLTADVETVVNAGPNATEEENATLWAQVRDECRSTLDQRGIGLIAQEVEAVAPELVHTDRDGWKLVDYGRLAALLVEAVKAQQSEVDDLRRRVAELEGEG
jgi:Chaperone of endosialidase